MTIHSIDAEGWLNTAEKLCSPNFDTRPENAGIRLIVIHGISLPPGEFGGGFIQQFFCNRLEVDRHPFFREIADMRVSAHCLIERGGNIIQFVSFLDRAWHAGVSSWHGEQACNDFSVGIELEGTDTMAYSDSQYEQLVLLIQCLRARFPQIDRKAVCGHSDIAPGRKTDPGLSFDWARVRKFLDS